MISEAAHKNPCNVFLDLLNSPEAKQPSCNCSHNRVEFYEKPKLAMQRGHGQRKNTSVFPALLTEESICDHKSICGHPKSPTQSNIHIPPALATVYLLP